MTITCPSCGTQLQVGDEHAGKMLKCPKCQIQFQAPVAAQLQQSADPLDELAAAISTPRTITARRPMTRRVARRKSKAPAIIGVIAIIVVIGIIGAIVSNSGSFGGRTDPNLASDEEIIKAVVGAEELDYFRRLKDADYAEYRRSLKLQRKSIIMSGLTCEEYAQRKAKHKMVEKKMEEWWKTASVERDTKEAQLRVNHRSRTDVARREWRQACEARESIRLTGLSADEYQRRRAEKDAALAREQAAGKTYNDFARGRTLTAEINQLRDEYNARARAYRENLLRRCSGEN